MRSLIGSIPPAVVLVAGVLTAADAPAAAAQSTTTADSIATACMGADAAFLIAQHNASLQRTVLRPMGALPRTEVSQANLAMLEDRVLASDVATLRHAAQVLRR
jgi:hypothetical protein